jgi:hypothetical protein
MIVVIIVAVFIALALSLFLAAQFWGRFASHEALRKQTGELNPVDLEAFENLTDPEEEHFLRTNLSPAEFRGVQRGRIRAARLYVAALSQNAAVLVAVGQTARSNSDAQIAAAGEELVQRAIRLRVWCLLSLLRMHAAFVLPAQLSLSGKIANQYMLVTYMAANLPRSVAA